VMPLDRDAPVPDDVSLFRRVHPVHLLWDENLECSRLSTGLFRDPNMSVDLGDKLAELEIEPSSLISAHPDHALVAFLAGAAREQNQDVVREPTETQPTHGLVVGKKTGARQRALARASASIVSPADACHAAYP
jgi:hypothetical protein